MCGKPLEGTGWLADRDLVVGGRLFEASSHVGISSTTAKEGDLVAIL